MSIVINGSGTITGITAGGLPDGVVTAADLASGAARSNWGAGGVLQVVQSTYNTSTSTTSTSFVTTGLNATITPTSATSKILVLFSIAAFNTGTLTYASFFTIYRGTVSGTNLGHASNGFGDFGINSLAQNLSSIVSSTYLDSPATTSAQTYTVGFRSEGGGNTITVCRIGETATMTLLEIAA